MDPAYIVTLWFSLGIFLHVAPKLQNLTAIRNFVFVIIFSFFIGLLPDKNETQYDIHDHLIKYFFICIALTFFSFRNALIPKVNEHIVAVHSIILWYAILFLIPERLVPGVICISVIPTAIVIHSIFERRELDYTKQIVLYFWNDLIYLMLFFIQLDQFTKIFPTFEVLVRVPVLQIIMSGMMFASIGLPIMGLLFIIPIPGKRQSLSERMAEIREYMGCVVKNFTEENTTPAKVLFMMMLSWGMLFLNRIYPVVSEFTLINILILSLPYLIQPNGPDPVHTRILTMEPLEMSRTKEKSL